MPSLTPYQILDPNTEGERVAEQSNRRQMRYLGGAARDKLREYSKSGLYDNRAAEIAKRYVESEYPDLDPVEKSARFQEHYKRLKLEWNAARFSQERALGSAVDAGAFKSIEDVLPTHEQGVAIEEGRAWRKTRRQAIDELAYQADDDEAKIRIVSGRLNPEERARLSEIMEKERFGAQEKLDRSSGVLGTLDYVLGAPSRFIQGGAAGSIREARRLSGGVGESGDMFLGINTDKLDFSPGNVFRILKEGVETAWESASGGAGVADLSDEFNSIREAYHRKAEAKAIAQLGHRPSTDVEKSWVKNRSAQLLRAAVGRDMGKIFIDNPNATQFGVELVFDPLNLAGVGAVRNVVGRGVSATTSGASKLARRSKAIDDFARGYGLEHTLPGSKSEKLGQAVGKVVGGFKFMPEAERIAKATGDSDTGALLRKASAEALSSTRHMGDYLNSSLNTMRKVPEKLRPRMADIIEIKDEAKFEATMGRLRDKIGSLQEKAKTRALSSQEKEMAKNLVHLHDGIIEGRALGPRAKDFLEAAGARRWGWVKNHVAQVTDDLMPLINEIDRAAFKSGIGEDVASVADIIKDVISGDKHAENSFKLFTNHYGSQKQADIIHHLTRSTNDKERMLGEHLFNVLNDRDKALVTPLVEKMRAGPVQDKLYMKYQAVEESGDVKGYMPHLLDENGQLRKDAMDPEFYGRSKLQIASAKKREGSTKNLRDPVKQWEAWGAASLGRGRAGIELRKLDDILTKGNMVLKVDRMPQKEMQSFLNARAKETGMEWVVLADDADELGGIHKRLTAAPGTAQFTEEQIGKNFRDSRGVEILDFAKSQGELGQGSLTVVPKHVKDLYDRLSPFFSPGYAEEAGDILAKGINDVARRYMRVWRLMKTIPNPAFSTRNAISGFGLSTISLGLKAFDPFLQSKAVVASALAASGNKKALDMAGKINFTLKGGQDVTLRDIIHIADEVGITSQLGDHLALDVLHQQQGIEKVLTDAMEFRNIPGLKNIQELSPAMAGRVTENYQHLVAFMGFLEDTSERGIARALDLTSKFSGNYSRLGAAEKGFLRNFTGFYAWNRFIFPFMMGQLAEHPHRLAAWAKSLGGLERWMGDNAPYGPYGQPEYLKAWSITAPKYAQLKNFAPGTHRHAMAQVENPLMMGFGLLPAVSAAFTGEAGGTRFAELLGPLAHMGIELITSRDIKTGQEIPGLFSADSFPEFAASRIGKVLVGVVDRPSTGWYQLMDLYSREAPIEKIELDLRYAVGRYWLGLDNWFAKAMGKQPRSLGGMTDPESGGVPGAFLYAVDPLREAARRSRRAGRSIGQDIYNLRRVSPYLFPDEEDEE